MPIFRATRRQILKTAALGVASRALPSLASAAHPAFQPTVFDEVEYGEYVGTPDAYAVISNVDEVVRTEQPGTLQLPTAIAPTIPGGIASGPR